MTLRSESAIQTADGRRRCREIRALIERGDFQHYIEENFVAGLNAAHFQCAGLRGDDLESQIAALSDHFARLCVSDAHHQSEAFIVEIGSHFTDALLNRFAHHPYAGHA